MQIDSLVNMAAEMLSSKLGIDQDTIKKGVEHLFSDGFDISNLLSVAHDFNLGDIVSSWIGNGENKAIDPSALANIFGSDKISQFAKTIGVDENTAVSSLSEVLPNVIDKATSSGDVMDSLGDFAKKLF